MHLPIATGAGSATALASETTNTTARLANRATIVTDFILKLFTIFVGNLDFDVGC